MPNRIHADVTNQPLDITKAYNFIADEAHGATDMFVGHVRNNHQGKAVEGMSYEVHPTMTVKVLEKICQEAVGAWPQLHVYVSHYYGECALGQASIIIAVSTPHRDESFEACRYLIEEIKKRAPIWKREHYTTGKSAWLPGFSLQQEHSDTICCGSCQG